LVLIKLRWNYKTGKVPTEGVKSKAFRFLKVSRRVKTKFYLEELVEKGRTTSKNRLILGDLEKIFRWHTITDQKGAGKIKEVSSRSLKGRDEPKQLLKGNRVAPSRNSTRRRDI